MKKLLLAVSFVSFACYAKDNAEQGAAKTSEELCEKFAQYSEEVQYEIMHNVHKWYVNIALMEKYGEKIREIARKVARNKLHGQDDLVGLTEEEISLSYLFHEEKYLEASLAKRGILTSLESIRFVKDFEAMFSSGMLTEELKKEGKKLEILDQISTRDIPTPDASEEEVDKAVLILFVPMHPENLAKMKGRIKECYSCFDKVLAKQREEKK